MAKILKYISFFLISFSVFPLFSIGAVPQNTNFDGKRITKIVIDPGHGGKDPGAIFGNAREKDIVLDIGLILGKYININFPEIEVIYTRKKDVFVPLYKRAEIANKNKADLFISIHANSTSGGKVQGTESYVLGNHRTKENLEVAKKENSVILLEDDYHTTYEGFDPNSSESYIMFELIQDEYLEQSVMLASAVQDQFREHAQRIDRSVRQAGFLVLRQSTMPSILIETGFLSHPEERKFLMSKLGREYLASAIFRAFRQYKKRIEAKSSFQLVIDNKNQKSTNKDIEFINNNEDIYFSIQIVTLSKPKKIKPNNFKGEKEIFVKEKNHNYKYFCGKFKSYEQACTKLNTIKTKFNDAFIVAFNNNETISLDEAKKKTNNNIAF